MSVSLSNNKKKAILDICENTFITSNVQKLQLGVLQESLGSFPVPFLAVTLGRLHYMALERFKTEASKENKGNFDKIVIVPKPNLDDILWWQLNIPSSFAPIVIGNPSITINIDASSFGWGACTENGRTGGQFNLKERELHINNLKLKFALYGLRPLCDSVKDSHILLQLDSTSEVAAINKIGSTQSSDVDHVAREIWHWVI